jgi:hypothetical protein
LQGATVKQIDSAERRQLRARVKAAAWQVVDLVSRVDGKPLRVCARDRVHEVTISIDPRRDGQRAGRGLPRPVLLADRSRVLARSSQRAAAGKTPSALLRTIRRHGGRVENVVKLEVDVPQRWLRRSKPGL